MIITNSLSPARIWQCSSDAYNVHHCEVPLNLVFYPKCVRSATAHSTLHLVHEQKVLSDVSYKHPTAIAITHESSAVSWPSWSALFLPWL